MTWKPGRERIEELVRSGELEEVAPDSAVADLLLADSARHVATATAATDDLSGAYQLAYDALRKSATALLAAQGLRATSRGGHIAVQDAVQAQFGSSVRAFKSFSRIRRLRNSFEYPSTDRAGPDPADVADAIRTATEAHAAAETILRDDVLTPW